MILAMTQNKCLLTCSCLQEEDPSMPLDLSMNRPLLSRKPDGASNPRLDLALCEENGKAGGKEVLNHYATPASQNVLVYSATTATHLAANKDGVTSSSLSSDPNAASTSPNLKGSKLAVRTKPPLPQKPTPSSSSSSSPSSPSPASSSAASSPKAVAKPSSSLPSSSCSSPKSGLPVLGGARRDKDKVSFI